MLLFPDTWTPETLKVGAWDLGFQILVYFRHL